MSSIVKQIVDKTGLEVKDILQNLREGVEHYSFSKVEKYNICSLQWFYKYILKFVESNNPPALVGNVVHETLKKYFTYLRNTGVVIDENKLLSIFRKIFNEVNTKNLKILEGYNYNEALKLTKKLVFDTEFINSIVLNPDYDIKFEEEKEIFIDGYKFKLAIDLVAEPLVKSLPLVIIDYKTGYHKEKKYITQLMTYFLAYKDNYDGCVAKLIYPRHDKSKEGEKAIVESFTDNYMFDKRHIKEAQSYILQKIQSIERDLKYINIAPCPNNNCQYCSFSDICTYNFENDKKSMVSQLSPQEIGEKILYAKAYVSELQKIMKQMCDNKGEIRVVVNKSNPENDVIFYKDEIRNPYVDPKKFIDFCKGYGLNYIDFVSINTPKLKELLEGGNYPEVHDIVNYRSNRRLTNKEIKKI